MVHGESDLHTQYSWEVPVGSLITPLMKMCRIGHLGNTNSNTAKCWRYKDMRLIMQTLNSRYALKLIINAPTRCIEMIIHDADVRHKAHSSVCGSVDVSSALCVAQWMWAQSTGAADMLGWVVISQDEQKAGSSEPEDKSINTIDQENVLNGIWPNMDKQQKHLCMCECVFVWVCVFDSLLASQCLPAHSALLFTGPD